MFEKGGLPVQASCGTGRSAGDQPLPVQVDLDDGVPVAAAETADNDGRAPRG